ENKQWLVVQLVNGESNPYALWKLGRELGRTYSDQQVSNDMHDLEKMRLVHGAQRNRGRIYYLDRAVLDLLPSSAKSSDMKLGLRLLCEAVPIKQSRGVRWTTAFAMALINHLVVAGRPYPVKGSVKAELLSIVSILSGALQTLPETVPLLFLPFKTEKTPEQIAMVKHWADWADKSGQPEARKF